MIRVAITGPSGSGKSTLLELLGSKGYPIIDCDKIAHQLQSPGEKCYRDLVEAFGEEILRSDGSINRKLLAAKAFSSKENTVKLNSITHHYILDRVYFLCEQYEKEGNECVFIEGGALFESGLDKKCNKIVLLTSSYESLIERICDRDSIGRDAAERRLKSQIDLDFLTRNSHLILFNNSERYLLNIFADLIVSRINMWGDTNG